GRAGDGAALAGSEIDGDEVAPLLRDLADLPAGDDGGAVGRQRELGLVQCPSGAGCNRVVVADNEQSGLAGTEVVVEEPHRIVLDEDGGDRLVLAVLLVRALVRDEGDSAGR